MLHLLRAYFERDEPITDEQFDLIQSKFILKQLKKGEFLLREGEIARYGAFVAKGCLRSYVLDNKGKQHIVQFAPENWWLTDADSILQNKPTIYFMDAIEDTAVFLLDPSSHIFLLQHVPAYATQFQTGIQKHAAAKDKRIVASLSSMAEERYKEFIQTYPSIVQRVPQHMLASYLGIMPETLSRIRKQMAKKK
ncbi:MAG: Crp/Fnr family transcriptional regulator [Williamsia sp.]|nr:Crp/Fnr family transcriptional regulator [Williamsia sp.]